MSAVLVIPFSVWSSSHCFGTMTSGTTSRKYPFFVFFFVTFFSSPKALKRAKIAPCEALPTSSEDIPAPPEGFLVPSEGFPDPPETLSALSKAFPAPSETLPIPSEALPVYLRPSQLCQRPSQVPQKPFQPKGGLS